ncbi:uncharacterized protein BO72DRAFT_278233 [Aspergillus fijiensis CBS 313.89]|uniref:non-specific serine/threonine protein kinase n=1 Tax=Aspergillus fijiensis CBS 313.89 TaxID=1448319 RepID=A0A8G1RGE0_9EURO|nr:uncharacterized protein BO72DRAFT_278233 [Aspergillus fijiensis CBS 313.89]RAK72374.1 hypothetical protein BO72DRAFT_278233 [Aspergillus fijiensis CBS 313.89]
MVVKSDSSVSPDEPLKHEKSSDVHPDDEGSIDEHPDDEGFDDEGSEHESSEDTRELVILELPKVDGADYADEEIEAELTRVGHWKSSSYAIRRPRMFIPVPKPEIKSELAYTMLYHKYLIGRTTFRVLVSTNPPPAPFDQTNTNTLGYQMLRESDGSTFSFLRRLLPELCQPFFKAYADWTGDDLESHLLRAEVHLHLVTTKDGLPTLINLTPPGHLPAWMVRQGPGYDNTPWLDLDIPAGFPRYDLAAARFLETMAPNWVYKVEINGTPLIYKRGKWRKWLTREATMLRELEGCSLRVPKLAGFIGLESHCPGILVSFIPHETTLWDVRHNMQTTDLAVRHKWFDQIHETVMALHQRGMTWGDVKPDNVLVDSNQDAWIIDLEGGFTKDYVPLELTGTVAGDLVGLKAIREFLCLPD